MEKEHFYKYRDNLITFNRGYTEDDRMMSVVKTTATPSGVKVSTPVTVVKPPTNVFNTDILKPSINNTGVYNPVVEKPGIVLSAPKTAVSPIILQANVPGGMEVKKPSIILEQQKLIAASKAGQIGMMTKAPEVKTLENLNPSPIVKAAYTGNKLASMGLPSPLIIGGMIVALIAFYFISRKKK